MNGADVWGRSKVRASDRSRDNGADREGEDADSRLALLCAILTSPQHVNDRLANVDT
jgi:hypothetical protein